MSDSRIVLTDHARQQIRHRNLDEAMVMRVAETPEQIVAAQGGREIRQSRVRDSQTGRTYLVRVVVDNSFSPAGIITAYRTRRIATYWSRP